MIYVDYYSVIMKYVQAMLRRKRREGCTTASKGSTDNFVLQCYVLGNLTLACRHILIPTPISTKEPFDLQFIKTPGVDHPPSQNTLAMKSGISEILASCKRAACKVQHFWYSLESYHLLSSEWKQQRKLRTVCTRLSLQYMYVRERVELSGF